MIKKFEKFEKKYNIKNGDYVVIRPDEYHFSDVYNRFLSSHIGQINRIEGNSGMSEKETYIYVRFEINDEKDNEFSYVHAINANKIIETSKNKEDLIPYISANKYNL